MAELDDEYIERMEEVLALYERALNPDEPVLCLDEKSVTLHAEVRPSIAPAPGKIGKRDGEYERCGTANLFCVVEPKAGRHFTQATPNRSAPEFAKVVRRVVSRYPSARIIHLVMDNLNTHGRKSLTDCYGEQAGGRLWRRLMPHYTPKHGSWLNQAEIEIGLLSRQCLGRRRLAELATLRRETRAWTRRANRRRLKINWCFDRREARRIFGYQKYLFRRSEN